MKFRFQRPSRAWALARAACMCAVLPAVPLSTFAATPLTLQAATQLAVDRAPMLDARRAGIAAAQAESERAGALPDPTLAIGIDNWPVTGPDAFKFGAEDMTMKKIGLRQELPARAKRQAQRALADRGIAEARAMDLAEHLGVRRAAAEAWVDLWTSQRELDALQRLRDQAALARVSRARVAGGGEPVSDALATEAAVLELDNRLEAAHATRASAQAALARWSGDTEPEAVDPPDFRSLPVSGAQLLASVDGIAPLLAVDAQVETAAAAIDAARAEKRPDWSIAASYGLRADGRSDMLMLEVGVGLPLFARNRQDRGVAAREADYRVALATREDLRRQEAARIRSDIARWEGLKRQVALYESALLPLAGDRSTTALAAYRAGGGLQPWLAARRDELDARLAHVESLGELARTWTALAFLLATEDRP